MSSPDLARMNATGIGFAGIDGAWWRPAARAAHWPASAAARLDDIARAVFVLLDAVLELYPDDGEVAALLDAQVPAELRALVLSSPVLALRPDFQVVHRGDSLDFVATELEICPSAHGFAHAMQVGYGLSPDLLHAFVRLLRGRELLIAGSSEWSEFLIEQLAFCRALQRAGARARVLYDRPLAELAADFRDARIWQPPMFGIERRGAGWNDDLMARLSRDDLLEAAWPGDDAWPEHPGDALVFRFGYLECFGEFHRGRLARWQREGVDFVNPTHFALDSKCVLAALTLPTVRARISRSDDTALAVLDDCIPDTCLLDVESSSMVSAERERWIIKYAGFDAGNRAWGGRSLAVGASQDDESWSNTLQHALTLPWPVVAQRAVPSRREDVEWLDADGGSHVAYDAVSRLRSFLVRHGSSAKACGSHLTWSASSKVSEAVEAVQAPVLFGAD